MTREETSKFLGDIGRIASALERLAMSTTGVAPRGSHSTGLNTWQCMQCHKWVQFGDNHACTGQHATTSGGVT